ncbi:mannitol dehydrogenase family protein [Leeia sp. TBRC 13508]|uniref:Mannitol dehydrogenase family protein n=1 Tax=Leeia speluncae TaxID=2884804 RepID=A0ABS8D5R1_9NEIS|nr:D-arabinitol 4-dehydrogenase [Leeia speluncae]MCB6183517.1 mannitol dehydrogenase family protein [Leeia speluncae]
MSQSIMFHLGLGSFHRAHQAVYLQQLINSGDDSWVLAGGNIRPDMLAVQNHLASQNGQYTLETISPAGECKYQTINSIRHVVGWDEKLTEVIEMGSRPETRIISFTVTEAGYYLTPKNTLDRSFADLNSDLEQGTLLTIYGALTAICKARVAKNSGQVTLLSCDNLRSNGERFRAGFVEFLQLKGETDLLAWVEANTTCPNDMVDRITPRPLPEVAVRVKAATGVDDACPVMGEEFIQWVVEEHFINGRPAWENVGVEMVESVLPYEEAKIRILNASHSCIAWAGTLKGYSYIHEGSLDAEIRQMAHDYVTDDVIPCLSPSPIDLGKYRDTVLDRFSNPYIQDTNQRVAADGFSKIPGFIAPTFRECLAAGRSFDSVALLPALFLTFLQAWAKDQVPYVYQDQGMDPVAAKAIVADADPVAAFCRDRILWGDLAGNAQLEASIRGACEKVNTWLKGA